MTVVLSPRKTGSGLAASACCHPHCLPIAACVCSWPWPVSLQGATHTALSRGLYSFCLSNYCMSRTVCPTDTSWGTCIISVLCVSTVGEDFNLFSLKPGILTGSFWRWPTQHFGSPHMAAAAKEDPMGTEHCWCKAVCGAEDAGLPTAWAKPTLQQRPHGKHWPHEAGLCRRVRRSGTSRHPACRVTYWRSITTLCIYPIQRTNRGGKPWLWPSV